MPFLPAFMEQYNARFAKAPFEDRDVHRTLVVGHDDLDDAFAWKEERTVSVNLTLQYDQVLFILEPTGIARSLARKRVTVVDYPDGRLAIRYHGVDLPYRTFDKRPQVIRRWQRATGKDAILEATGQTFEETQAVRANAQRASHLTNGANDTNAP
jgi:hypothetical protein